MSKNISEKWVQRYFNLAAEIGNWSKDPSTQVGAIVVGDQGQILSTGYNGFPRGVEDHEERLVDRNEKLKYTVHAEMNCIYNAGLSGVSLRGSSLFCVGLPVCDKCAPGIIQTGIKHVYMCYEYPLPERWKESCELSLSMLTEAGVECHLYPMSSSSEQIPQTPHLQSTGSSSEVRPSTDSMGG